MSRSAIPPGVEAAAAPDDASSPARRRLAVAVEAARRAGLLGDKSTSVAVRLNPELLQLARARTGAATNSALVELALANLVAEDGFAEAFAGARGAVPADLDLGV